MKGKIHLNIVGHLPLPSGTHHALKARVEDHEFVFHVDALTYKELLAEQRRQVGVPDHRSGLSDADRVALERFEAAAKKGSADLYEQEGLLRDVKLDNLLHQAPSPKMDAQAATSPQRHKVDTAEPHSEVDLSILGSLPEGRSANNYGVFRVDDDVVEIRPNATRLKAIVELIDIRPDTAAQLRGQGIDPASTRERALEELARQDLRFLIAVGNRIPRPIREAVVHKLMSRNRPQQGADFIPADYARFIEGSDIDGQELEEFFGQSLRTKPALIGKDLSKALHDDPGLLELAKQFNQ